MASSTIYSPNSKFYYKNGVAALPNGKLCTSFAFKSTLFGSKYHHGKSFSVFNKTRPEPVGFSNSNPPITASSQSHTFDVVIIGAGIIGLTIARQFLIGSDLSVAVVDKALPCSGATGAGQGYIWRVHKTPGSDTWDLTMRSHKLWEMLADSIRDQGLDPLQVLGWKKTGSMLVGRTAEESVILKRRVEQLSEAGLRAEYLSSGGLLLVEPELLVGRDSGAAFLPDDCQLDAQRTVAYIEEANRHFALKGRYAEFYNDPVTCLLRSGSSGEVEGIQTSKNTLYSKKAIVVAAGCWSGSLMRELVEKSNIALDVPVKPRKAWFSTKEGPAVAKITAALCLFFGYLIDSIPGHLLVIENFNSLQLNHGLMEVGYVDHQEAPHPTTSAAGLADHEQALSVSMTATMDTARNLVLGSSRQFAGFSTEVNESVIDSIWKRAGQFFPKLRDLSLSDFIKNRKVRIGLRPYMPDGKPVIGPVPALSNVYLATGHEGEGLSMALGTAEMVADMVLGNTGNVDYAPFAVQDRCC